ncbi:MAG TPA: hypothetical protein DEO59_13715 [Balneola sp.]|nr:hypothetical protein [Balneola sp.]
MGMFDNIIVPKSYLRGLLDKKQEKLLKGNHTFQTKSLDNTLSRYKIYAQRLYKLERSADMGGGIETWRKLDNTVVVVFYDTIKDKKENEWWFEFGFTFNKGKLDKKELISCKLETTKAKKDSIDKMWNTEQEIFNEYRKCFKYRFFAGVERTFLKLTNWARKQHTLPLELRRMAYEKSGRLNLDPKALELYEDI